MKGTWTLEEVKNIENMKFNSIYTIEESISKPGYYIVIMTLGMQCFVDSEVYFQLLA